MTPIEVKQANFETRQFETVIINPDTIVSCTEHDFSYRPGKLKYPGQSRVCEIALSVGDKMDTIYVLSDLKSLYNKIVLAHNPDFQPSTDVEALAAEWAEKAKSRFNFRS